MTDCERGMHEFLRLSHERRESDLGHYAVTVLRCVFCGFEQTDTERLDPTPFRRHELPGGYTMVSRDPEPMGRFFRWLDEGGLTDQPDVLDSEGKEKAPG